VCSECQTRALEWALKALISLALPAIRISRRNHVQKNNLNFDNPREPDNRECGRLRPCVHEWPGKGDNPHSCSHGRAYRPKQLTDTLDTSLGLTKTPWNSYKISGGNRLPDRQNDIFRWFQSGPCQRSQGPHHLPLRGEPYHCRYNSLRSVGDQNRA